MEEVLGRMSEQLQTNTPEQVMQDLKTAVQQDRQEQKK